VGATRWVAERRRPKISERRLVLSVPRQVAMLELAFWVAAAVLFAAFNGVRTHDWIVTVGVGGTCVIIGLIVSSISYLMIERMQRPIVRRVLARGVPDRVGMRIGIRSFLAWLLGSGVMLVAIAAVGWAGILEGQAVSSWRLSITMVVLGMIGVTTGGVMALLDAQATSEPIRALRRAVRLVQDGDLNHHVPIYDGTEIGILQAGFNDALKGMRERERIRDLFGRHVGLDVAHAALKSGVQLGGEVRHVGALFVDVVGSTAIAANRPPEEVVTLLNRFFAVVIEVVHAHGGLINKFEGDAALAIWGAPGEPYELEGSIVAAARVLSERLRDELPDLPAAIGVSAGRAVAGNVGAAERYEYTVIGDPVNEAARLTELAKAQPSLVLCRSTLLEAVPTGEASRWVVIDPVVVRGRTEATPVATLRD
jgi:adenylate cyclase